MTELDVEISIGPDRPESIPTTTVDVPVVSAGVALKGWSLAETTGAAAASVQLLSGGNIVAVIDLAQGTSQTIHIGGNGVRCRAGLLLHVVSGSVNGAIYLSDL